MSTSFDLILCFRVAADALRILLARAQLDEVMNRLDEDKAWEAIREPNTHTAGVALLARYTLLQDKMDILDKIRQMSVSSLPKPNVLNVFIKSREVFKSQQ